VSAEDTSAAGGSGRPSEEELRAAYEAELARITSVDMIAQSIVSLLSIGARRLGAPGGGGEEGSAPAGSERDLEQVRDAIDAVRGLLDVLERRIGQQELRSLRDALSQLQLAYAREVQAEAEQGAAPAGAEQAGEQAPAESGGAAQKGERTKGPAESSGKLWVPGE
jgi:Domain of unknown function (DUF1844)